MLFLKLKKLFYALKSPLLLSSIFQGVAPSVEHLGFLKTIELNTLIDVGANRGQFSLMARSLFPEARIVSFEPLPAAYKNYIRRFRHDRLVYCRAVAIGAGSENVRLNISNRDDSSSLLDISDLQNTIFPGTYKVGEIFVPQKRLDQCIKIDDLIGSSMLKIDVQGAEMSVLNSATGILNRIDIIYIELSFVELYANQPLATEIIVFLNQHGFRLTGIYNLTNQGGKLIQADFYFRRE